MKRSLLIFIIMQFFFLAKAEEFDIEKFTDPLKYNWQSEAERKLFRKKFEEQQKLLQIYNLNKQSIYSNMLKSAAIPGWGQFSAKAHTRGQVILGIELVLMGSSLYFYDITMDNYDKYKNSTQVSEIKKYYNDANSSYKLAQGFVGLYTLVWLYSLYDTAAATSEYNDNLWQSIYQDYFKARFYLSPNGIGVNF